jgi:AraC-like DNA-binding protein
MARPAGTPRPEAVRLVFGYLDAEARPAGPADAHDAVLVRAAQRPPVVVKTMRLGPVDGCVFEGDEVDVSPHHLAPADDGLIVGYVLRGAVSITQLGHTVTLEPGQLAFYDGCTRYRVQAAGPHRYLVLRVPSPRIRSTHEDSTTVLATDVSCHASAPLLAALLERVAASASALSPAAAQYAGEAIAACVHAVILDSSRRAPHDRPGSLFLRLTQWLDEHLADETVSAESLAAAQFLSARYVRRVFARHETTVSAYVRDRRLDRIRDDLLDPRHEELTVSAVAARWGFGDRSVFSRAFHRRFGCSPGRFRQRYAAGDTSAERA